MLDRDRIVAAALEIADAEGAGAVSMSAVAARLGVAMPALYYHVANADELLGLVAAGLFSRLRPPDRRLRWDRWLKAFGRELRDLLRSQPALTEVRFVSSETPFEPATVERALFVLTRDGFELDEAFVLFALLTRSVSNAVKAENARSLAAAGGRDPLTYLRERTAREDPSALPLLTRFIELSDARGGTRDFPDDDAFEWQLDADLLAFAAVRDDRLPISFLSRRRRPGRATGATSG